MKFIIADNLYSDQLNDKAFKKTLRKVALKRPVNSLYVVTEPLYEAGILEIYNYNELLQPFYRKMKRNINIYGVATSRDSAKQLVLNIVEDSVNKFDTPDIKRLFEGG